MKTNQLTLVMLVPVMLALMSVCLTIPGIAYGSKNRSFDGPIVAHSTYEDGHTATECLQKCEQLTSTTNNAASASRADSASAARSQNNVKCFAFCLGISNANSGSAANSDSRTNSPGNTAAALPVSPQVTVNPNEITPLNTEPEHHSHGHGGHHPITNNILADNGIINNTPNTAVVASAAGSGGTACFDNNGSVQDEGYSFGYFDSQHGKSIMSVKDHGNHTDEWRTGYNNGWNDGAEDLTQGIHRYPC